MDHYRDHALCCAHEFTRGLRNDSQTRLFDADLSKASRHPVLEPPQRGYAVCPDIKAPRENGGTDYYHVTASRSLTSKRLPSFATCLLKSPSSAALGKGTRLAKRIRTKGPGNRLIALPSPYGGGQCPAARSFPNRILTGITHVLADNKKKVFYSLLYHWLNGQQGNVSRCLKLKLHGTAYSSSPALMQIVLLYLPPILSNRHPYIKKPVPNTAMSVQIIAS